jgi:transposase
MIRTSKHTTKFANANKLISLDLFLEEYKCCLQFYIDFLWNNEVQYEVKKKGSEDKLLKTFNVLTKQYECPSMLSTKLLPFETTLFARALKCCITQACGVVRAVLKKPKSYEFVLAKLIEEGKDTSKIEKRIAKLKITKPEIKNIKAELNSICCDFVETNDGEFDGFLQLKCLGESFGKIRLPVKFHEQSNKWKSNGKRMASFLVSSKTIEIRWDNETPELREEGETLGADQGYKTVLTFSNEMVTPKTDCHGHSLETIQHKLARKKKGSKAFKKAQDHRKNFINWEINQLNLGSTKTVNLEKVVNIRYKSKSSRLMSHWTNTLIRDKLTRVCEESGVQIVLQSSTYRSQRCFCCGWVQKRNRKSGSKEFHCRHCGHQTDADLNAAKNHSIKLPDVSFALRKLKLNRKGFFWNPEGFMTSTGEDLTVLLSQKKGNII